MRFPGDPMMVRSAPIVAPNTSGSSSLMGLTFAEARNADHNRQQHGHCACVGNKTGQHPGKKCNDQNESPLTVRELHNFLRHHIGKPCFKEGSTYDAHGEDKDYVGVNDICENISYFDDTEKIQDDGYTECHKAHRKDIRHK